MRHSLHLSFCVCCTIKYYYPCRHIRRRGYSLQSRLSVYLFVCAVTEKRFELSTPNLVHIYSIAVAQHSLTYRSKGQGHTVTKTATICAVVSDHGPYVASPYASVLHAAVAGLGLHVDTTAYV